MRVEILDQTESSVSQADVKIIFDSGKESACLSNNRDNFICEVNLNENFTLEIRAEGFSILRQTFILPQDFTEKRKFTLSSADLNEEVFVTANRTETRLGETAASIVALSPNEIETTAAPTIDDKLRQVAGFSLFRRTGSRYANPTSQGVSLRGVGASGASRSLVLFDGVPLNDVFGGWILWSRVAPIAVERIEVLRGGASSLYGSDSLSGAINILPRKVSGNFTASAEIYAGTQKTFSGSTFFGFAKNDWSADFTASHFQTKGYIPIDKNERGAIDSFSGSRNANFSGRIGKDFGENTNLFFKTSYFGESRTNGTPAQINRTHLREFVFGGNALIQNSKFEIQDLNFNWRIFGGTQVYNQTFSAVSADRNSEILTRRQGVPAQNLGFSGQISGVFLKNQTFVFGAEAREVRGASDEIGFFNGNKTSVSGAGGRERTFGIFIRDFARIGSKFILTASVRFDDWRNFRALNSVRTLSNNQTVTRVFPDRNENAFSPQISALYQINENFSVFALASKSFRAPTLNELYRSFRVGNILTNANENLNAETAMNYETGANFNKNNFYLRGSFFYTEIKNPVANATLSVTPNLIARQRQNIGKTRAAGIEIEAEKRFRQVVFSIGYLLADSRVTQFPSNRELENLLIPQVARHQFTFQTNYTRKNWTIAFQGRASSKQFDDDLNTLELEPFFQLDFYTAKRFKENWQVFAAVENLFNSRYSIAKTPVRSVSAPINLRIGFRYK
ncbi:MAG: TonB-dependent receptor [Pyrinomonadaceae bacterium]